MRKPTEMELRVAEAILGTLAVPGVPLIKNTMALLSEKNRAKVLEQSRAAIRAMREPTPEMDQAGDSEIEQQCDYSGPFVSAHKFVWKAMINAASPEEE